MLLFLLRLNSSVRPVVNVRVSEREIATSTYAGLTNHVKHEVPYQKAQCHSTAKYESSRCKDK